MPFLAVVSPLLRATKPGEKPEDDQFWWFISKKQIAEFFTTVKDRYGPDFVFRYRVCAEGGEEGVRLNDDEAFMMSDVRAWLRYVWEYLEYYDD